MAPPDPPQQPGRPPGHRGPAQAPKWAAERKFILLESDCDNLIKEDPKNWQFVETGDDAMVAMTALGREDAGDRSRGAGFSKVGQMLERLTEDKTVRGGAK